jgi:hypothetical protein
VRTSDSGGLNRVKFTVRHQRAEEAVTIHEKTVFKGSVKRK